MNYITSDPKIKYAFHLKKHTNFSGLLLILQFWERIKTDFDSIGETVYGDQKERKPGRKMFRPLFVFEGKPPLCLRLREENPRFERIR